MLRVFTLAVLVLMVALGALFARRVYVDRRPPEGVATFQLGGRQVTVERAMVRDPDMRDGGAVNRLDLALSWPDFRAAPAPTPAGPDGDRVFIALEDAASRTRLPDDIDPADRPVALYSRFLERDAWSNPGGLVMRRFRAGTPYDGEELYISTPDERVFAARCPVPGPVGAGPDELCLWQTRINGLEVQARFPARLLTSWLHLAQGVRNAVTRLPAN